MATSSIEQRYEDYFQAPLGILLLDHQMPSSQRGDGGRWHGFDSGYPGVMYRIAVLQGKAPAVRLLIDRNDRHWNARLFWALFDRREAIESGISASLNWDYAEKRRRCIVSAVGDGDIDDPHESWGNMQEWMVDRLLAFKRVFGPHLAELVE